MPENRTYDVVLYGASGFVGRQTVAYFAKHAPASLQWAVAGRSQEKLNAVLHDLHVRVPVIVANAQDAQALGKLVASTRVVLSTAGPYALYGSKLLAACVAQRTHYVDLTGESPWVRAMIDQHHAQAVQDGTRIVPCCGFDSVPSDLGAYLVAQEMLQRHGEPCLDIKASFTMRGGLNGGTLASVLNIMQEGQTEAFNNPFLLNPEHKPSPADRLHDDPSSPYHDADFNAWMGPFFMGPINTRVVRRSAALWQDAKDESTNTLYAKDFHYQEYMRFGKGGAAALAAASLSAGTLVSQTALKFSAFRKMTAALAPKPGEGPSERSMDGGSFRCELIGKSASGKTVRAIVSDKGDPGNRATTKFICEAALALAVDALRLPGGSGRGGVITPAFAFGDVLAERLRAVGMRVEVAAVG